MTTSCSLHTRRGPLRAAPILCVFVCVFLAACTGTPQNDRLLDGHTGTLPARAVIGDVVFVPQEDLWCGPASMAMALTWAGVPTTQDEAAAQVYTPGREGTLAPDIVAAARRNGRLAVPVGTLEDLLGELAAGHPVIVFQNLALDLYPQWHYAVAYGYDLDDETILLHSGTEERRATDLRTFEHTWRRTVNWALVVLPPDTLPATAGPEAVAAAAAGIERAGRPEEASTAYRAIVERWPGNGTAWLGLGNLAHAAGDTAAAAVHYRAATEADPGMGAAWNNLAFVLAEHGDKEEAMAAIETALALGDGETETYLATRAEIAAMP